MTERTRARRLRRLRRIARTRIEDERRGVPAVELNRRAYMRATLVGFSLPVALQLAALARAA